MDMAELKEKHLDLVSQIVAEAQGELKTQFDQERNQMTLTIQGLQKDNVLKDEVISKMDTRLSDLETKQIEASSDSIWKVQLLASSLPDSLWDKVKASASFTTASFIKEDRSFDKVGYATAVTAEIKDWEERAGGFQILGKGTGTRQDSVSDEGDASGVIELWKLSGAPEYEKTKLNS